MFKSIATSTPTKATFYINRLAKASYTTTSLRMQNQAGQGASHAVGDSKVPGSVQEKVPQSVEEGLPNSIHDTGSQNHGTSGETHAKDGGEASIVPKGIQKAVPESVERALPNAIHDTGDK